MDMLSKPLLFTQKQEQIHPRYLPGPFKFSRGRLPMADTHLPQAASRHSKPENGAYTGQFIQTPPKPHLASLPINSSQRWLTLLCLSTSPASLSVCWPPS